MVDLRRQVEALEADLRARAGEPDVDTRWRAEHAAARRAQRTASTYAAWLEGQVTQVAVAWVLATVFVRFCEDNELVEWPFLAGPGERLAVAEERHEAFFRRHPEGNDRDWLVESFDHLASTNPAVAGLFDRAHNPLWDLTPSSEAATALLAFWRRLGPDGATRWVFTGWDTRFLGDLYQDLSEDARTTYALFQTPAFVEEFILDLTLDPAIAEFGLSGPGGAGLRAIDPTCGSGHFVLGLFARVLAAWRAAEPGTDDWTLIRRALASVHGVDKNPFAVAIARFRLLVAVLAEAGVTRLDQAPEFPMLLAVGDSLIHGRGAPRLARDDATLPGLGLSDCEHTYTTEDVDAFVDACDLLGRGSYHVVVGNPPHITVKDKGENASYRARYDACAGTYALSVPFAQRFFQLAVRTGGDERVAGFVAQITANSFMKRDFGKRLIEDFFPTVHLTHVIDTSGAYIPGHGAPTVILVGRNHLARQNEPVRAVLGVRGEPNQPADPAKGLVWQAITTHIGDPGADTEWVTVTDAERHQFARHPWSLSGGGAGPVLEFLERSERRLSTSIEVPAGRAIRAGADEAFIRPLRRTLRTKADRSALRPLMLGEVVRDWRAEPDEGIWYPHQPGLAAGGLSRELWPWRAFLAARRTFHGDMAAAGPQWWEYLQHTASTCARPLSIAFAFVATHNHFVLDRGGKVFNRSAPVIKLPEGATEEDHLALLGVLNSSTACFWLKQASQSKGGGGLGRGLQGEEWEERYEFTGTALQEFPLPEVMPLDLARALDGLARRVAAQEPSAVCGRGTPTREVLDGARHGQEGLRRRMIGLQEELDWLVYAAYGLLTAAEAAVTTLPVPGTVPEVALGERAFEIALARRVAAGEAETVWFDRHGSTPATDVPGRWPEGYRRVVQARIDLIGARRDLALLERPECKRRWAGEAWAARERRALAGWLLDRCEDRSLWYAMRDGLERPRTLTVAALADRLREHPDVVDVAGLYAADHLGNPDLSLAQVLDQVIADQHVPYLAALRCTASGLAKRAGWEHVWQLQREEDTRTAQARAADPAAPEVRLEIPVPPKYRPVDFTRVTYWVLRGKLDVPTERFVSYPGASPDTDHTLLLGWAGWDHEDQAQALVDIVLDRTQQAGWDTDRITPLLAGLAEVLPWVRQWHSGCGPAWGGDAAEEFTAFLHDERTRRGLTDHDLAAWRPAATRRRK